MTFRFVHWAQEKLVENLQHIRGSFSFSKEIMGASLSIHKTKGAWRFRGYKMLSKHQKEYVFLTNMYTVAEMFLLLLISCGCWFNHEITGTVAEFDKLCF